MRVERTVEVFVCDNDQTESLTGENWYELSRPRHAQSADTLNRLHFCTTECVYQFMDKEITVFVRRAFAGSGLQELEGIASFVVGDKR